VEDARDNLVRTNRSSDRYGHVNAVAGICFGATVAATDQHLIMSAETIARWNAIPMTRPENDNDGLSAQFASTKVLLVLLLHS
jgi:hypothetical protein